MFQYKTRGNADPQGKQKVYFTCHPDDFGLYYEKISGQILDFADCAIWHWDSGEDCRDIQTDLYGMRMFVIPVTRKLLETHNRTMDTDLPFAFENHIPVLPLMQESGLDELFCGRFGSLHYLDESGNKKDLTAVSYEEKLKHYLATVIVGDELAAKVRQAFDAYIFLSYRKKDREHAQKLMRLIHENDFCRDIAIWYDEFLTPGENFNSAIAIALEKSELFALVVTPNLVNEENYVRRMEYPLARKTGKKILPTEMVYTDHAKLAEMYEDIPDCINASDSGCLSDALLDALRNIAKREHDGDPEHHFFIGLAYLSGIDVEINAQRAKELILSAAEAGLPEALEKLVSMYQNGDGVDRDYHQAIAYQRKLADLLREKYQKSGASQDGKALGNALYELGNYLYDIRNFAEVEAVYKEMAEVSSGLNLAGSYCRLGDLRKAQGQFAEAEDFYRESLELVEPIARDAQTVDARRDMALLYARLGGICRDQEQLAEAEGFCLKSLEMTEAICKETQTLQARRDLAVDYIHLGDIRETQGQLAEAEGSYQKSLEFMEAIDKEAQTVKTRCDLARIYGRLGGICETQGKLAEAEDFYRKTLELTEVLARELQTVDACTDLAMDYARFGNLRGTQGEFAEAEGLYRKSMELAKALAEETRTVEAYTILAVSYASLGGICEAQGRLAEAEIYHKKAWELREERY